MFLSDNVSGMHPAIAAALSRANDGYRRPYGDDELSARLDETFSRLFDTDVAVVPCVTGTAANALSFALLARPYNAVCVHADAHVYLDECNAPEFYTGGARQVRLAGDGGRIDPAGLEAAMAAQGEQHSAQPSAVSVSQTTEIGSLYRVGELEVVAKIAREHGLGMHMDGARFANAVAALDCHPADISWRAGVDILSFGATKNGCLAAEAMILFDPANAKEARYRLKQAGQLVSKQRFLAAQLLGYVEDDLWLGNARHANAQAGKLVTALSSFAGVEFLHDDETNMRFVRFTAAQGAALDAAGLAGHRYPGGWMRLVCSWATEDADIERFVAALGSA